MLIFLYRYWVQGLGDKWRDKCCAHARQGSEEAGLGCKSLFPCCNAVSKQKCFGGRKYVFLLDQLYICVSFPEMK